jgi:hypothetical protein
LVFGQYGDMGAVRIGNVPAQRERISVNAIYGMFFGILCIADGHNIHEA